MRKRLSPLWRRLNPTGAHNNLFTLTVGDKTLTDKNLLSVTITRGDDTPHPSLSPSVTEWQTSAGTWASERDVNIRFGLSASFAESLGGTGLAPRSVGRLGSWQTHDDGGKRQTSTIQAVHWSALIRASNQKVTTKAQDGIMSTAARVLNHKALPFTAYAGGPAGAPQDLVWKPQTDVTRADVLDTLLEGTGSVARELRDGSIYATDLVQLEARTRTQRQKILPILRRNGIAPATWEQPVGHMAKIIQINRIKSDGTEIAETAEVNGIPDWSLADVHHLDWTNIRTMTDSYKLYMAGLTAQANYPHNRLKSVELDISRLLSSPSEYDRRIAVQVLGMEVNDTVLISGDWPVGTRGTFLANQITERITPDSWRVTLGLHSSRDVFGWSWTDHLNVPMYTWGQMNMRPLAWRDALKPWNNYTYPN